MSCPYCGGDNCGSGAGGSDMCEGSGDDTKKKQETTYDEDDDED